jgi:hypothetical protein
MSGGRRGPLLPLIVLPVVLYIAIMAALAMFVVHPPLLGWIGLAVAALTALLATALAITFFSRMRTNAERLHPRVGSVYRLVVVTDVDVEPAEIRSAIGLRAIGRNAEIRVVAPVIPSTLHFALADEERESAQAARRLQTILTALADTGVAVHGAVGTDDPLQAVGDVLAAFPGDEILLVSSLKSKRPWLDRDFERRARDLFGVPVSTVFGVEPAVTNGSVPTSLVGGRR